MRGLPALLLLPGLVAGADIERVEPPSWWIGMAEPTVQLLVHGEEIADLIPRVNHPGVTLRAVHQVESRNYLFLDLHIDPQAVPGEMEIAFTQDDKVRAIHAYPLAEREPGSAARQGFDAADVIYLLMPDRFANGDASNDTIAGMGDPLDRADPYGRHGGDLRGIIDHLGYLADMGFTQLWLNPVLENAMPEASYHGYAATDFYRVDARLGDNALYRRLADAAREHGIGLIQDVVLNHAGSAHWWMDDPPSGDWINYAGEFNPTNHRRETLHDPHAAPGDARAFADGWFVETMPDLNQRNDRLANYLIQNTIWWIEYAGLAGLRVDTYPYPDRDFLAQWTSRVMAEYPNLNVTGEEWTTAVPLVAYWQKGSPRYDDYRSELPSLLDFPVQDALILGLTESAGWNAGFKRLYSTVASDFLYGDPYNLVVFADNHDMSRVLTQVGGDVALARMALAYVLTTRGIPHVFYGTEILMANPGTDSHGVIRSDFPGGWNGDPVNAFTGKGLSRAQREMQDFLRKLLRWRAGAAAIHSGRMVHYVPDDDVYVYFRIGDTQRVMVAMNRAADPRVVALDRFAPSLGGATRGRTVPEGRTVELRDTVWLPPRTTTILELE